MEQGEWIYLGPGRSVSGNTLALYWHDRLDGTAHFGIRFRGGNEYFYNVPLWIAEEITLAARPGVAFWNLVRRGGFSPVGAEAMPEFEEMG